MSLVNHALTDALFYLRRLAVPIVVLALLSGLIILRRRLTHRSSHSCEDKTGPGRPTRRRRKARTRPALLSRPSGIREEPAQHASKEETGEMQKPAKQPYDAFLVLDVEATCVQGSGFDYPNEIIEWPVCLLRWTDKNPKGKAQHLEVVDEFRSFVKPTWRPQLSKFCQALTGITQEQVDAAPTFPEVLRRFREFLEKHELIDQNGMRLTRFCFCSDGPYDVRDFVVKQCFISKIPVPIWLTWDIMDVRRVVGEWRKQTGASPLPHRVTLSLPRQLHALGLEPFQGRQHSGIDDTRNICRLVVELARRGWKLEPNTAINPNRRWPWMGKRGKVQGDYY